MAIMFTRLFNAQGEEILTDKQILYDQIYFVSVGENFIDPLIAIQCKIFDFYS